MNYQETILDLCAVNAPAGFEKAIMNRIETMTDGWEKMTDARGNLIFHKAGSGKPVMLAAHADSCGFVVTYLDAKGYARVGALGYHDHFASLVGMPVRFTNGARGVIDCDNAGAEKDIALKNLYIAVTSGEIAIGDACAADLPAYADGDMITASAIESRAACAVLLDVMEQVKSTDLDLYAVFLAQSALGDFASMNPAFRIEPMLAYAVDAVPSDDLPGIENKSGVKLGGGPVLPVLIGQGAANMPLLEKLESDAEFPVQRTIAGDTKSALYRIQTVCAGAAACSVAFPARRYGSLATVNVRDLEQCAALLVKGMKEAKLKA